MTRSLYSNEEKKLLIDELAAHDNLLVTEDFECMEDLWPGLFKGTKRNAYDLFRQTKRLAEKQKIKFVIVSTPKRNRIRKQRESVSKMKPKIIKLKDQIAYIIQAEMTRAIGRMSTGIISLIDNLAKDNNELREEVKRLQPFKNMVDNNYGKELAYRG
jgi:uncharacterized protein YdcH (DUF465 family)